jgi:hypothetical protein
MLLNCRIFRGEPRKALRLKMLGMREPAPMTPVTDKLGAPSIQIEDVRLTLASAAGPVNILNGVSLNVARGEALALWVHRVPASRRC